jgi:hypothetical protein
MSRWTTVEYREIDSYITGTLSQKPVPDILGFMDRIGVREVGTGRQGKQTE